MINFAKILRHNIIGKLLNHLLVFLINVIIVRMIGEQSGIYFNELYLVNFVVFIFSAGLDYSAINWIPANPNLQGIIHRALLWVVLLFSLVAITAGYLLKDATGVLLTQPVTAIIFFAIGNLLLIFYQGILSALRKFNQQNIILGTTNLLFLLFISYKYYMGPRPDFSMIASGYALLVLIQGMLMCVGSYRAVSKNITPGFSWTPFLKHGFTMMLSSLVYFAFLRADNFFVEKYSDHQTLANYVQCGKVGQYFLYFSSIISSTLLPFIRSESIANSIKDWIAMMRPYIFCLLFMAIVIAVFGGRMYPFLFGKNFSGMNRYMLVLLPGYICLGMLTLINAVYIGKGHLKRILAGDIIGLAIVLIFDAWLVPKYGAGAAAITSSVTYCLVFLFLLYRFRQLFPLNPELTTNKNPAYE